MKQNTTLRLFSIVTLASASFFFASCGEKKEGEPETKAEAEKKDTPDSLTDELIVLMNGYADAMTTAKDKASAEDAANQLTTIGDNIAAVATRFDKLETPSEEDRIRLDEKMNKASESIGKKMMDSMPTIMGNKEVADILGPALMEFGSRMNKHNAVFERFGKKKEAPTPAAPAPAAE